MTTAPASTAPTGASRARSRRLARWPIALAAAWVATLAGGVLATEGATADGLTLLNRYLARTSFLFFIPIYTASPLRELFPGAFTRALVRIRRSLGIGYAVVMGAHLSAIFALFATPEVAFELDATAVGGGLGMLLIAALAATSNDASVRRLGARVWRRLHGLTIHFLWIIYAVTYLGRIERGTGYWPGIATVAALAGLRIVARVRR